MTRKFIITIQFMLALILCIGCGYQNSEPNRRAAKLVDLSSQNVSIDENLQIEILIKNTIHLIDMTYYEIYSYPTDNNGEFYFASTRIFPLEHTINFYIESIVIFQKDAIPYLFILYYSDGNIFYIIKKEISTGIYNSIFNSYLKNCEQNKAIGARHYNLYKAICREPRATIDEIVNILEEEL